ncbi:MAG: patatin-like phospholipase family protein [Desulfuromusa sp.]|nr:patatin-like phospholipase family protein [Desulfuromusa sp.]
MGRWFGKKKIALALGGGAARGLAHIGVLQAFEESEIPVDLIAGTSMGAIIGTMYAANPDIARLKEQMLEYLQSDIFKKSRLDLVVEHKENIEGEGLFYRFSYLARKKIFFTLAMSKLSFVSPQTRDDSLKLLLPDINLEETRIPVATVALDLISGREIVLKEGSLIKAVAATSALPGILPPVKYNGMELVDGGWIGAIPVGPAKEMGADIIIAVDVACHLSEMEPLDSGLDVVFRADEATRYLLSQLQLKQADLVICPPTGLNHWADFSDAEEIINKGRYATLEKMAAIKKLLK